MSGQNGVVWFAVCHSTTIKPTGLARGGNTAVRRKKQKLPLACRANSPTIGANSSDMVLPNKKPPSGGTSAAKRLPLACRANSPTIGANSSGIILPNKKNAVRRNIRREAATSRLSGEQPDDRRKTPTARFTNHAVSCRRMYRAARSTSNQGDTEGVDSSPRPRGRPPI